MTTPNRAERHLRSGPRAAELVKRHADTGTRNCRIRVMCRLRSISSAGGDIGETPDSLSSRHQARWKQSERGADRFGSSGRGLAMTASVSSGNARRIQVLPTTPFGRWALGLAGAPVVLLFAAPLINLIPGEVGNVAMFVTYTLALAAAGVGGIFALIAIIRHRDRAVSVFLAAAPLLMYVLLVVVEVIVGGEH